MDLENWDTIDPISEGLNNTVPVLKRKQKWILESSEVLAAYLRMDWLGVQAYSFLYTMV